ncbi:TetR family transcriptional regulator [Tsukamurella pulmonis]|uniref:Regulatory protein, tetR family n=1 Tax=Tsukamurella pulmonis TaxID=47312 RepID=A0A1H1DXB2_9ACTN|nr:TetR family transcriptional regulator C-terminal domain-containing protein [Tsukamurella pulmonis]KXO92173.1 TetR family transcriptional regulator [Tsukamurella pulmonis]SDQ80868.1 regulatory protein, tetR family [Tsukamurella pulmonis]SUP21593.1 transcriptional regulator BetI [Tsukamurella pulmonis]
MPKQVDHQERREEIARALWRVVERSGVQRLSLREVAKEAAMSHGQLQHYFASRQELLTFAMDLAAERTAARVAEGIARLGPDPHPRDILRLTVIEMLPLHEDARATSRMSAAYVLEALHDESVRTRTRDGMLQGRAQVEELLRQAIDDGQIAAGRAPSTETDRVLALTGLTPLLELGVITADDALAAVDRHLDELFAT